MEWALVAIILFYLGWNKLGPHRQRSTLSWFWVIIIIGGALGAAYSLASGGGVSWTECAPNPYYC